MLGLLSELLLQHAPSSSYSSAFLQSGSLLPRLLALLDVVLVEGAKVGVGVGAVPALGNLAGVVAHGHHSIFAHALAAKARPEIKWRVRICQHSQECLSSFHFGKF